MHLSIRFYPLFHFKIFIFTKIEPSSSSGQPNQFLKDNDYKLYVVHMLLEYVYTVVSLSFMCIKFFLSKIYLNFTTIESLSLFLMDIYFHALPKQWFVFNQYGRCQCCFFLSMKYASIKINRHMLGDTLPYLNPLCLELFHLVRYYQY